MKTMYITFSNEPIKLTRATQQPIGSISANVDDVIEILKDRYEYNGCDLCMEGLEALAKAKIPGAPGPRRVTFIITDHTVDEEEIRDSIDSWVSGDPRDIKVEVVED